MSDDCGNRLIFCVLGFLLSFPQLWFDLVLVSNPLWRWWKKYEVKAAALLPSLPVELSDGVEQDSPSILVFVQVHDPFP